MSALSSGGPARRRGVALVVGLSTAVGCGRVGFDVLADGQGVGPEGAGGRSGLDASAASAGSANAGSGGGGSASGGSSGGGSGGVGGASSPDASQGAQAGTAGAAGAGGGQPDAATGGSAGAAGSGGTDAGAGGAPGDAGPMVGATLDFASGHTHACAISSGELFCWGDNTSSALGQSALAQSSLPVRVGGEGDQGGFVEIDAGQYASCARRGDGSVWCWGLGSQGTLGQGDTTTRSAPVAVPLPSPAREVSLQFSSACAILTDDSLWCWGDNDEGQMGQNDGAPPYQDALSPVQVSGSWRTVSAADGHVCAIATDGGLWCWGRNSDGQLAQGPTAPVQIRTPVQVGTDVDWQLVEGNLANTCAIRTGGTLWCSGDNANYQMGTGDQTPSTVLVQIGSATDWDTVALSPFHGCGIRGGSTLWCWGRNDEGQLGVSFSGAVTTPTQTNTVAGWLEIDAGWMFTCGRRNGTGVLCAGINTNGQIGDGTTTRPYAFVPIAAFPP